MVYGCQDTVEAVLRRLLPSRELGDCPPFAPDVFGVAAYLMEVSGAYHHIRPVDEAPAKRKRTLWASDAMRASAAKVSATWGRLNGGETIPDRVVSLWGKLTSEEVLASLIYVRLDEHEAHPEWWVVALELLMIADEAVAGGLGWRMPEHADTTWEKFFGQIWLSETKKTDPDLVSLALEISADVACVVPKCRTASVGCTLRSTSHHLALLPPQGITRVYWSPPLFAQPPDDKVLNLLLLPMPYRIASSDFAPKRSELGEENTWQWFDLEQNWLDKDAREDVPRFVGDLIERAERGSGKVNGVVFPELALNYECFDRLRKKLQSDFPEIELLIAGLSNDASGKKGNFAAMTVFGRNGNGGEDKVESVTRIRQKHHRWKLEASQISMYALSAALSPHLNWWEHLDIHSRSVDVVTFRESSTVTTLICEDLARVDPCQEALRAIGPNLVVALLMDGAQIEGRWPHRYATVLADDPGSSVLTLTSMGLIGRANDEDAYPKSRAVASWKDSSGGRRVLSLADGAQGILLTLVGKDVRERTLDGRFDTTGSIRWQYAGQQPVRLDTSAMKANYAHWSE